MNTNKSSYLIKSSIFTAIIFSISLGLAQVISNFVITQDVFSISVQYSLVIVILMLLAMYIITLSVGSWSKHIQYILIPVPVSLAIFLIALNTSITYAFIIGIGILLLSFTYVKSSTRRMNLLVKFDPRMVMKPTVRSIIFLFSVFGALIFLLYYSTKPMMNVGGRVAVLTEKPVREILNKQIPIEMQPFVDSINLTSLAENEINTFIAPYSQYINPIIAIFMFFILEFLATVAYIIYTLTVDALIWVAIRVHLLRIETQTVEKEILRF